MMTPNTTRWSAWIALSAFVYLGNGVLEPLAAWGDGGFDHYHYALAAEPELRSDEPPAWTEQGWVVEPPASVPSTWPRRSHAPRGPPA